LRCRQYRQWQRSSTTRQTIRYETIPEAIIEAIEDLSLEVNILDILRRLPLDLAVPLLMQSVLNCTLQEIADYHHTSRSVEHRKKILAAKLLRNLLKTG